MWQLPEVTVLAPHALTSKELYNCYQKTEVILATLYNLWKLQDAIAHLRDHLGELHGSNGGAEPAVGAEHVDTSLDQPDRLAQDGLGTREVVIMSNLDN